MNFIVGAPEMKRPRTFLFEALFAAFVAYAG
jgi:hypothetical protein